jgi:hypothetical protein
MASRDYCADASMELKCVLDKLQKLSSKIEHVPSIDKYKLLPEIQELNIIITELNDRIREMDTSCSTVERFSQREGPRTSSSAAPNLYKSTHEFFDYDFGG